MLLFSSTSCLYIQTYEKKLSEFPIRNNIIKYTSDPVVSYNSTNNTYIITVEYMKNSLNNQIFINEIIKWKEDNSIK